MGESSMNEKNILVVVIVNAGFVDLVMDAAREAGATGGTVIHGRGTGNKNIAQTFGIVISPNKEVVLIVIPESIHDRVVNAVYKNAGLDAPSQGIVFTLPLDRVAGLSGFDILEENKNEEVDITDEQE